MGSHQVRKSVKGKSTPAQHQQVGQTDDADEYEDDFEVHEDPEPKQSKIPISKKQQVMKQRSRD